MSLRPSVIAFDVIETVFSLETLRGRFEVVGLPGTALETWFAQTLRDAFALDATGAFVSFSGCGYGKPGVDAPHRR